LGRGEHGVEGGEVREKIEEQQYTSKVPSSMGATVHKLGQKYQPMSECISSLQNLLITMPQIPFNRSILKKADI
jgi:hypothetical protein